MRNTQIRQLSEFEIREVVGAVSFDSAAAEWQRGINGGMDDLGQDSQDMDQHDLTTPEGMAAWMGCQAWSCFYEGMTPIGKPTGVGVRHKHSGIA